EFTGSIDSIGSSSLVVAGRTVVVDGSTRIMNGDSEITLLDLVIGATVEVKGSAQTDGSVLAKKIKVED
ncbi:MAG: DUF5666 domain-containing protein, partial [Actinobacteria bacterium]|nr:DUF5666 domain-containing protein [Actinomycetota bacterium]